MVAAIGLLLISGLASAQPLKGQAPEKQSGLVVIKNSWRKGIRGPDLSPPILDQYPPGRSQGPNHDDPFQQMRQTQRRMAARVEGYFYTATIKNDGTKPIKAVFWDYTLTGAGDPKSLTHHQFYTRINIRPGQHKEIYRFSVSPPTRTISARADAPLIEEVVIKAVQYKDGSIWKLQESPAGF